LDIHQIDLNNLEGRLSIVTKLTKDQPLSISVGFLKDFPEGFQGNQHQKIKSGELSRLLVSHYGNRLTFNLLSLELEIDGHFIDLDYCQLFYNYLSIMGYDIGKEAAFDALLTAARDHQYHPVCKYLENIVSNPTIKPINLDTVASDYLGAESKLDNQILKTTLIAAVARVKDRGCKFDNCAVLVGKQGTGKSTFWRYLASNDFFSDTWQNRDQDLFMAIQSTWIFEIAELDRINPSGDKAAKLKALLSSSVDKFRRPYGKAVGIFPRPSILVSSCNRKDFLNDPTGNRRYWVIDLEEKQIDNNKVLRDRDRIWKAAALAYKSGMILDLPEEYAKQSFSNNNEYEAEDPFLARIEEWVTRSQNKYRFTTEQSLVNSGCRSAENVSSNDLKLASDCLRKLGFDKGKQSRYKDPITNKAHRARFWSHPEWTEQQKNNPPRQSNYEPRELI